MSDNIGQVTLTGWLICADAAQAALVAALLPEHIRLSRAEPGCLHFTVEPDGGSPLRYVVAERFTDQAAFEVHQRRARASDWGRGTAGIRRDFTIATERPDQVRYGGQAP